MDDYYKLVELFNKLYDEHLVGVNRNTIHLDNEKFEEITEGKAELKEYTDLYDKKEFFSNGIKFIALYKKEVE